MSGTDTTREQQIQYQVPEPDPDEQLLAWLQANDEAAFERIYSRYWSRLYLSAYNVLRDRQLAEDIVQEVLVSLWMRRNSLAIESLPAFLFAAVRYQVFKSIRSGKVTEDFFSRVELLSVENEAEGALAEDDMDRLLTKGVAELPEKCRQIFLLSRKENKTTKEIARWLGIAPKTVENQLTIALQRLRTTLGEFLVWGSLLAASW